MQTFTYIYKTGNKIFQSLNKNLILKKIWKISSLLKKHYMVIFSHWNPQLDFFHIVLQNNMKQLGGEIYHQWEYLPIVGKFPKQKLY